MTALRIGNGGAVIVDVPSRLLGYDAPVHLNVVAIKRER